MARWWIASAAVLCCFCSSPGAAQDIQPIADLFCTAAELPDSNARLDIWTIVPYAALSFRPSDTAGFTASYLLQLTLRDSLQNRVRQYTYRRTLTAPTYAIAQGATAAFDRVQTVTYLPPGNYTIIILLTDGTSSREYRIVRKYTVPDYRHAELALSSILLASRVEDRSGKPAITPFFAENLAQLEDPPFAVLELFSTIRSESLTVSAELLTPEHTSLGILYRGGLAVTPGRHLLILPLTLPPELPSGMQLLRVRLEREATPVAQSERSVRFRWVFWGRTLEDLDQAIRQLRYVAPQEELDSMLSAPSIAEKKRRFEAFWAALDPTPGTLRNEAFEEYYNRIAQANRLFRSYMDGWLTDRGMVYVIFGPPLRREQFQNDGRQYERWVYADREFLFVDYTGFGDYRLLTPLPPGAKYHYRGA